MLRVRILMVGRRRVDVGAAAPTCCMYFIRRGAFEAVGLTQNRSAVPFSGAGVTQPSSPQMNPRNRSSAHR